MGDSSPDMFMDTDQEDNISASIQCINLTPSDDTAAGDMDLCCTESVAAAASSSSKVTRSHSPQENMPNKKAKQEHVCDLSSTSQQQQAQLLTPQRKNNNKRPLQEETTSGSTISAATAWQQQPQSTANETDEQQPQLVEEVQIKRLAKQRKCGHRGCTLSSLTVMSSDSPSAPAVRASHSHTVLIQLPIDSGTGSTSSSSSPRPFPKQYTDSWDADHVRMPCSPSSLYTATKPGGGGEEVISRWSVIRESLSQPLLTVQQLMDAVLSYNARYRGKWSFAGLHKLVNEQLTEEESTQLFSVTLPAMTRLALRLPELVTQPPPLLRATANHKLTLSQLQIACLLANAFFCTFPRRNAKGANTEFATYPDINFNRLLGHKEPLALEKIKCILNYFRLVTQNAPTGLVTLCRQQVARATPLEWQACDSGIPQLYCHHTGLIEDMQGMLQVDFANRFVGGGVLGLGCVQEEIRFLLCPELLVTRLVTEMLDKTEALVVIGVEQHNRCEGYAGDFEFCGRHVDSTPRDAFGRRLCQLTAIDALHFTKQPTIQYQEEHVVRELNKAYAGFRQLTDSAGPPVAVATGNWGCGAFRGNPHLKALIQFAASGYAGRDLVYLTFGDVNLKNRIGDMHEFLLKEEVSVGALVQCICQYARLSRRVDGSDLFHYVYHSFSESQPSPPSSLPSSPRPNTDDVYLGALEHPSTGARGSNSSWKQQSRASNANAYQGSKQAKISRRTNKMQDNAYNKKISDYFIVSATGATNKIVTDRLGHQRSMQLGDRLNNT